ncbi:hypothetical protein [Streptomyces sp. H27-C3]|uniref:hypothetical protein n=1 Tax=Streptomyces sp. H27-C3 TaxID=3046305 RepID=UPI0024B8DA80|nr:hypothetical protein [Streptomyces sp. H27-C3]MDJ0466733.1 hypothetical protein [Streptomyces sp. H27-C3]
MHEHIAEAVKEPDVVAVPPGAVCLRFDTMKIYSALGAVRHLLDTGQITPGDTLVDSSSGIYAHALALACHRYGMKCHIVGSTTVDRSVTFGAEHVQDPDMIIAGIGSSIPFENVRQELYDRVHWVNFDYAMSGAVELLRASGIFAGLSAGAAYLATLAERERDDSRTYVFIAADTGHRYVDSAYANHAQAHGLGSMRPHEVTSCADLSHPWSAMPWPPPRDDIQQSYAESSALLAETVR